VQWYRLAPHLDLPAEAAPDILLDLRYTEVKRKSSAIIRQSDDSITRRQKIIKWNLPRHPFDASPEGAVTI
jgi:hypothetical protein